MPIEERRRLVEFARRYGVAILEDDVWSEFSYDAPAPPAIKSFDTDGHVVYVRSFSKLFEPSLRLAAVVAEGPLFAAMVEAKGYVDRFTSTFMQRAFLAYATSNRFHRGLRMARDTYRTRRDAMLHALGNEMPTDVTWNPPAANCNVWVKLPAYLPASEVARQAALKGVLVAQGESYYYRDPPNDRLRVTFSDNPIDVMEEGVRRLGAAVREIAYDPLRTAHLANWS
jgi:DNA-binding transcriptional MocR family regulator